MSGGLESICIMQPDQKAAVIKNNHYSSLCGQWYFVIKIVLKPAVRKTCSRDREKLLKFEAEGQEFSKFQRSPEQFIQRLKG